MISVLACCGPWGCKESKQNLATEQQQCVYKPLHNKITCDSEVIDYCRAITINV